MNKFKKNRLLIILLLLILFFLVLFYFKYHYKKLTIVKETETTETASHLIESSDTTTKSISTEDTSLSIVVKPDTTIQLQSDTDIFITEDTALFKGHRKLFQNNFPEIPKWIYDYSLQNKLEIKLRLTVRKDGKIKKIKLLKSSGIFELDNLTLNYVKKWMYTPSEKNNDEREINIIYDL